MATTNEKVTVNKSIKELIVGEKYDVHYFKFGSKTNRKTNQKFISASMILSGSDGVKFWCSAPTEKSAFKLIGACTANFNGLPLKITAVTVTENNGYKDFTASIDVLTK